MLMTLHLEAFSIFLLKQRSFPLIKSRGFSSLSIKKTVKALSYGVKGIRSSWIAKIILTALSAKYYKI